MNMTGDNIFSIAAHRIAKHLETRDIVERQLSEACRSRNIHGLAADQVHEAAEKALSEHASIAMAVAIGTKVADKIVRERACVRSRGHDDDGPRAA